MPTTTIHYYPSSSSFHFFLFSHIEYLLCFFSLKEKNRPQMDSTKVIYGIVCWINTPTNIIVVYWTFIGWWTKTTRVSLFFLFIHNKKFDKTFLLLERETRVLLRWWSWWSGWPLVNPRRENYYASNHNVNEWMKNPKMISDSLDLSVSLSMNHLLKHLFSNEKHVFEIFFFNKISIWFWSLFCHDNKCHHHHHHYSQRSVVVVVLFVISDFIDIKYCVIYLVSVFVTKKKTRYIIQI